MIAALILATMEVHVLMELTVITARVLMDIQAPIVNKVSVLIAEANLPVALTNPQRADCMKRK